MTVYTWHLVCFLTVSLNLLKHAHIHKNTLTQTHTPFQILPATCLSGIRHIPQPNQSVICNGKDRVTPNGCHSVGLQLDVFPSLKGHVCISGTNRQRIWHCHRNMVLRMDAANEGPPVLIQPDLSVTEVIIYCLHLLYHMCMHKHTH